MINFCECFICTRDESVLYSSWGWKVWYISIIWSLIDYRVLVCYFFTLFYSYWKWCVKIYFYYAFISSCISSFLLNKGGCCVNWCMSIHECDILLSVVAFSLKKIFAMFNAFFVRVYFDSKITTPAFLLVSLTLDASAFLNHFVLGVFFDYLACSWVLFLN